MPPSGVSSRVKHRTRYRFNGVLHVAKDVFLTQNAEQRCPLQGVANWIAYCCEHQTTPVPDRAVVQLGQRLNRGDIDECYRCKIDDDSFQRTRRLTDQLLGMLANAAGV